MEFETIIDAPMKEVKKQAFNCHSCQKSHTDALEAKKCFENCMGKSSIEHKNDEIMDSVKPIMSDKGKYLSRGHGKLKSRCFYVLQFKKSH